MGDDSWATSLIEAMPGEPLYEYKLMYFSEPADYQKAVLSCIKKHSKHLSKDSLKKALQSTKTQTTHQLSSKITLSDSNTYC